MNLSYISKTLEYKVLQEPEHETTASQAYTSDLLSDVMGNAPEDSVLITVQGHKNTVAVASLAGMKAIILCNNRSAPDEMLDAAAQEGIAVYGTRDSQFTASYKVARGLKLV